MKSYLFSYYDYILFYTYEYKCDKQKDFGCAIYATLLLLMIAEFFVAMAAAILCCKGSGKCCNSTGSHGKSLRFDPESK